MATESDGECGEGFLVRLVGVGQRYGAVPYSRGRPRRIVNGDEMARP
jgi:hypothetical protein